MTYRLGLTGSIGMGKSTTASLFAELGCAVWDADAAVHRCYAVDGAAVPALAALFPDAIVAGAVSRARLRDIIATTPDALTRIERVVHPLVAQDRASFADSATADILVFDIPLLFETGGDTQMDGVAVVYVNDAVQRARVLARGTMTEAQFEAIKAKQMPTADKRARADFEIETDTLEHARAQVQRIVTKIRTVHA